MNRNENIQVHARRGLRVTAIVRGLEAATLTSTTSFTEASTAAHRCAAVTAHLHAIRAGASSERLCTEEEDDEECEEGDESLRAHVGR